MEGISVQVPGTSCLSICWYLNYCALVQVANATRCYTVQTGDNQASSNTALARLPGTVVCGLRRKLVTPCSPTSDVLPLILDYQLNSKLGRSPWESERLHGFNRELLDIVLNWVIIELQSLCVFCSENSPDRDIQELAAHWQHHQLRSKWAASIHVSSRVTRCMCRQCIWGSHAKIKCIDGYLEGIEVVPLNARKRAATLIKGRINLRDTCLKMVSSLHSSSVKAGHIPRDTTNKM